MAITAMQNGTKVALRTIAYLLCVLWMKWDVASSIITNDANPVVSNELIIFLLLILKWTSSFVKYSISLFSTKIFKSFSL